MRSICTTVQNQSEEEMMEDEIYNRLREHIDSMPAGYPATDSGAEIKMLKKFYTPLQARLP